MRSGSFYDDLKDLNNELYSGIHDYKQFKTIEQYSDHSGVLIGIFQVEKEYIFAIKGTDPFSLIKDWQTNRAMGEGKIPKQFYSAEKFYKQIKDKYHPLIFTGYSLGGSIAQMLGSTYGNETICYEPYGTKNLKNGNTSNIINFGNLYDWVFMINFKNQVGKIYLMSVNAKPDSKPNMYWHIYNLYGTPSKAKEYNGKRENNGFKPDTLWTTEKYKHIRNYTQKTSNELHRKSKELVNKLKK